MDTRFATPAPRPDRVRTPRPERAAGALLPPADALAAMREILDLFPYGVAFLDFAGRVVVANQRFDQALAQSSGADSLRERVAQLALRVSAVSSGGSVESLDAAADRFHLRGSRADLSRCGHGAAVLVELRAREREAEPSEALRQRFGLTATELRVARLLSCGRSNKEIASELKISPNTARHHTEHVLSKLGVRSRAGVAMRLNVA